MNEFTLSLKGESRLSELDFIKGIMIFLMVLFHLGDFNSQHYRLSDYIYSFHMLVFLIISGFLFNPSKNFKSFWRSYRFLLFGYLIVSVIYCVALWLFGQLTGASNTVILLNEIPKRLLLQPVGTLWYIYLLLLVMPVVWIMNSICRSNYIALIICSYVILHVVVWKFQLFDTKFILFFFIGQILRYVEVRIFNSWLTIAACIAGLVLLSATQFPVQFKISACLGNSILYFILLFCLYHKFFERVKIFTWLGKNTLPVVYFSFFLTPFISYLYPFLAFDESRYAYGVIASTIVIIISIGIAFCIDWLGISTVILGSKLIK